MYLLKRKMVGNVKLPVTSKPDKQARTHNRSKCVICLEDN